MVLLTLTAATPALARPGFSIGIGLGGTSAGGSAVSLNDLEPDAGTPGVGQIGYEPTTEIDGGFSPMLHLGFNILGYAALELVASGQPPSSDEWSGLAHVGVRAYPMWHWQSQLPDALQPLEPSLFFGWGTAWQGYSPNGTEDVAWRTWKSLRLGVGMEYFVVSFFKLSLQYFWVRAPHDRFLFDAGESWTYTPDPAAVVNFHQLYLTASFQFGPAE
jgi:hypothetical protein